MRGQPVFWVQQASCPTSSLVDAAANFPPPHAEVPQPSVSLPQSPYDNTEVMHTDVSVKRKRK